MNTNSLKQDHLSALADGQVLGDDFSRAMAVVAQDEQAVQSWHLYHVIGDVMRSDGLAPAVQEWGFWERLESKLDAEPVRVHVSVPPVAVPASSPNVSANDSSIRWKWFASVSFSALLALVVIGGWPPVNDNAAQLAGKEGLPVASASPAPTAAGPESAVMVRDPELDALMAAHRQLGGHSAFQTPSGFLRNATFERPSR
jgi:sigma-E factor negative regulatory protein RseA